MNWKKIICICVVFVAAIDVSGAAARQYTAKTFIQVLPYTEKDPFTIETPPINENIQYGFRVSMAELIRAESTLQKLLERDKIRQTNWFKNFGENRFESSQKGLKDLQENFGAGAQKEGHYIEVSMTCRDSEEAALIVNEMVDLFLSLQENRAKEAIAEKISAIERRRTAIRSEMIMAEKAMDEVRTRFGIFDLDERAYTPLITRMIRLEEERDNCLLDIRQLQTKIEHRKKESENSSNKSGAKKQERLESAEEKLIVLKSNFDELKKMCEEAAERKKNFDLARNPYVQRAAIRDERRKRLDEVKLLIEKFRMMHDDPDISKVRFIGYASVPMEDG
jgi:uncharacterized protein involved in exopolysaccharide biosynthesis